MNIIKKLIQKDVYSFSTEDHKVERTVRYMPWFTDQLCLNILYGDGHLPSPDGNAILHSHPWDYFTFIIWGGYDEIMLDENNKQIVKRRKPGYFGFHKLPHYHALVPLNGKAITLFWRSKERTQSHYWVAGKPMRMPRYWLKLGYSKEDIVKGFRRIKF